MSEEVPTCFNARFAVTINSHTAHQFFDLLLLWYGIWNDDFELTHEQLRERWINSGACL